MNETKILDTKDLCIRSETIRDVIYTHNTITDTNYMNPNSPS